MKIFISWSGDVSRQVATELRDWLPLVLSYVKPFVSSEDIRKGNQWRAKIASELGETKFGIACLTTDNTSAPWLLFETGALSKSLEETSVCTLLIPPLKNTNVKGPLAGFQHTNLNREDMLKLVHSLNAQQKENPTATGTLDRIYNKWWPDLDEKIQKILTQAPPAASNERSDRDMLMELLELTRTIARQQPRDNAALTDPFAPASDPFAPALTDPFAPPSDPSAPPPESARYIVTVPENNSGPLIAELNKLYGIAVDKVKAQPNAKVTIHFTGKRGIGHSILSKFGKYGVFKVAENT